ncbi:NAD(P)-dependent alcohol dehydrogenase [Brachybacterium phenoliresistens]|uniref:NAD(P)-dependent alcohol dehydrogenase n=1 Tax=Brachybacterium phenoliresistens TaxID=396014 RepID=UPI0031D25EDC
MRAAVVERYGPPEVVGVQDVPVPRPRPGQVLIRVERAAVTSGDARMRAARFPAGMGMLGRLALGVRGPRRRIPGTVLAGTVEAVGEGVRELGPGDRVAAMAESLAGAHAELCVAPLGRVARLPEGAGIREAAALMFGGTTALWFLRDRLQVREGTRVLVMGASGVVGTAAVQLAALHGAVVTAAAGAHAVELLRELGAERVVDPAALGTQGPQFDAVVDTTGTLTLPAGRTLLAEGGGLALVSGDLLQMLPGRGRVITGVTPVRAADMTHLLELLEAGRLRAVIDRELPLEEIAAAHRRVETRRTLGSVLVAP